MVGCGSHGLGCARCVGGGVDVVWGFREGQIRFTLYIWPNMDCFGILAGRICGGKKS
jgi:hypothetical protein